MSKKIDLDELDFTDLLKIVAERCKKVHWREIRSESVKYIVIIFNIVAADIISRRVTVNDIAMSDARELIAALQNDMMDMLLRTVGDTAVPTAEQWPETIKE